MKDLYGSRGWAVIGVAAVIVAVLPFLVSSYWVTLLGKIMCYAMVAVAMDLAWGYAGCS